MLFSFFLFSFPPFVSFSLFVNTSFMYAYPAHSGPGEGSWLMGSSLFLFFFFFQRFKSETFVSWFIFIFCSPPTLPLPLKGSFLQYRIR